MGKSTPDLWPSSFDASMAVIRCVFVNWQPGKILLVKLAVGGVTQTKTKIEIVTQNTSCHGSAFPWIKEVIVTFYLTVLTSLLTLVCYKVKIARYKLTFVRKKIRIASLYYTKVIIVRKNSITICNFFSQWQAFIHFTYKKSCGIVFRRNKYANL